MPGKGNIVYIGCVTITTLLIFIILSLAFLNSSLSLYHSSIKYSFL